MAALDWRLGSRTLADQPTVPSGSVRLEREASNPDAVGVKYHNCPGLQILDHVIEIGEDQRSKLAGASLLLPSKQQDRRSVRIRSRQQFPEVHICGYDNPIILPGHLKDRGIGCRAHVEIPDMDDIVPRLH